MPTITRYGRRLREEPAPLRFLASGLLWRSGLCRHLATGCRGYLQRFYPTSLSAAYWTNRDERTHDRARFERYLPASRNGSDSGCVGRNGSSPPYRIVGVLNDDACSWGRYRGVPREFDYCTIA